MSGLCSRALRQQGRGEMVQGDAFHGGPARKSHKEVGGAGHGS